MAARQGLTHRQHNRACRERIAQELLKTEARLERVREKEEKFIVDFQERETERGKRMLPVMPRPSSLEEPSMIQSWMRSWEMEHFWAPEKVMVMVKGAIVLQQPQLEECRAHASELIDFLGPDLVIGSPPCGPYSMLQELNVWRTPPDVRARTLAQADEHLEFCCKQYEARHRRNKYFLHEHPAYARSWGRAAIQRLE